MRTVQASSLQQVTSDKQAKMKRLLRKLRRRHGPQYADHFNTPLRCRYGKWYVNERIVELPFIHRHLMADGQGRRALDFGSTRSPLVLQLASLGYDVVGVDLRPYPVPHPRLSHIRANILDVAFERGFDLITAVSVIEHVGLGSYGEDAEPDALGPVIDRLTNLLNPGGRLLVTVPVGHSYVDEFLRIFDPREFLSLFSGRGLSLVDEQYYCRKAFRVWQPCPVEVAGTRDSSRNQRGPTGVNAVGCFAWIR